MIVLYITVLIFIYFFFPLKVKDDDLPCEVCRDSLEVLENIIKENRTKEIIKEGLDRLCTLVPSSISQKVISKSF